VNHFICLADFDMDDLFRSWSISNTGTTGGIIIFGAVFLAAFAAFVWVAFFRKQKRERKKHYRDYVKSHSRSEIKADSKQRKSRRHAHKIYKQLNPTLAEVGGLPPIRPDDQTPPSV
jgi:hypothetical protein